MAPAFSGTLELIHATIADTTMNINTAVKIEGGTASITNTLISNHAVGIERLNGTMSEDYT